MSTFLLILKVLGIVISSASVIGSDRLKTIENRLRTFLDRKNLNLLFKNILEAKLNPIFKQQDVLKKGYATGFKNFALYLGERFFKWSEQLLSARFDWRLNNKILDALGVVFNVVARLTMTFIFGILFLILMAGLFIVFILSFTMLLLIYILIILTTIYPVTMTIDILRFSIWVVSRPYVWLDFEIQKRKIESTLVVIGILIAIVAEILGNYYQ